MEESRAVMRFQILLTVIVLTALAVIALDFMHYPLWVKGIAYIVVIGGLLSSLFLFRRRTVKRYQIVRVAVLGMMLAVVIVFDRTGHGPWARWLSLSLLAVYFASGPFVREHD
jgi:hypothetical protein